MAATTSIQAGVIEEAVKALQKIVTPEMITRFKHLRDSKLYAGEVDFFAAQWLEDVCVDRCHGLYEHVVILQKVFEGLATALDKIKTTISGKDSDAASSLAITEINSWIKGVTSLTMPPALGKDHYLLNHNNKYDDSTDDDKDVVYNLYNLDPHGYAQTDGGGNIVIDTDDHKNKPAVPGLWADFYGQLIKDVSGSETSEDWAMMDETVTIKESETKP